MSENTAFLSRCKVCGFEPITDGHRVYSADGLVLLRCPKCGFVFDPDVDLEKPQGIADVGIAATLNYASQQENTWGRELERISRYVDSPGTLLDVGCGTGGFCEVAKARGFVVSGVELNSAAVQYVEERGLFPIYSRVSDPRLADESLDVVTAFHTLEHVADPERLLGEIRRVVKSTGLVAITVPCYNRLTLWMDRISAYTNWHLVGKGHLNYFTPKTLKQLLNRAGYDVVHHPPGLMGASIRRRIAGRFRRMSSILVWILLVIVRALHGLGIDINLTMYARTCAAAGVSEGHCDCSAKSP